MKNTPLLIVLSLAVVSSAAAQTKTRTRRSVDGQPSSGAESPSVRNRVVGTGRVANHAQKPIAEPPKSSGQIHTPFWGDTAIANTAESQERTLSASQRPAIDSLRNSSDSQTKLIQETAMVIEASTTRANSSPVRPSPSGKTAPGAPTIAATYRVGEASTTRANSSPVRPSPSGKTAPGAPTIAATYRVGAGDVLDVRLVDLPTRESTLFTVLKDGVIEYPLVGTPIPVDRLTTDEIASLLSKEIRVINRARVTVIVRDYASHSAVITGLVDNPGRKILRREATPLYILLVQALPRADASVVTITHLNGKNQAIPLADAEAMSALVLPGDTIKVSGGPGISKRFLYVGGDVAAPGEKEFRDGITLTQALLAAGGISRDLKHSVRVARRDATGFLVTSEYDLQSIAQGKTPDPLLEAGDRIEVTRGVW